MNAWADLIRLIIGPGGRAPTWAETRSARALEQTFHQLHVCPGAGSGKSRRCGYVYIDKADRPARATCPLCKQYRCVQTGPLKDKPRLVAYVMDLPSILRMRFAEPGFPARLNPRHGQVHHAMRQNADGTWEVDREYMMEV